MSVFIGVEFNVLHPPTCTICEEIITPENDSVEHIIPQSICGRKKVRAFICRGCNNRAGESWDAALAKQLNWFTASLGIRRERSKGASATIQTVEGVHLRVQECGALTRERPFFQKEIIDGVAQIRMFARSESEAREMLRAIKKKYPKFDLGNELRNLKLTPYRVGSPLQYRLEFGGPDTGRSVVKTAIAYCVSQGITAAQCDLGQYTLRTLTDDRGFALYYLEPIPVGL